ncbi:class II aldolase/adducin family protein [Telmatospirillum sp. J64-1]|uniref:class II aldolase/adducin family protein n=1 Tax=Telmatospirillum sp. J64-1 TaxID=2502183 RepID=UPI0021063238|nr:class II aldolase/adducin family protein [Telmatospirillum sp. J64-1]
MTKMTVSEQAQPVPYAVSAREEAEVLVRRAARALARHGLVHAYGHCSLRLDSDHFLVCAAKPMGLIEPGEAGTVVPVHGPLPEGVLGEVRIHQMIYRRRPDVGGVVRSMPPKAMSLSTLRRTPSPRHGFGSYFAPRPPLWDNPMLLRDDAQAAALAETLGDGRSLVMRGNGVVTAAETLEQAVVFTWYLEDAARVELDCLAVGSAAEPAFLTPEETVLRATGAGRIYERMWDYLTSGDPE